MMLQSPTLHPLVSWRLAVITVTGRRTGLEHTFPVAYRLTGDTARVTVAFPAMKLWWRNLRGDGAPIRLLVKGVERVGHARAVGDADRGVEVRIELESPRR